MLCLGIGQNSWSWWSWCLSWSCWCLLRGVCCLVMSEVVTGGVQVAQRYHLISYTLVMSTMPWSSSRSPSSSHLSSVSSSSCAGYTQIPSYLSHPGHALAEISFTQTLNKYLCATKDMGHQAFERGCQYPNNTVMGKGSIEGQRYVARSRRSGLSNIFLPATSTLGCMHWYMYPGCPCTS